MTEQGAEPIMSLWRRRSGLGEVARLHDRDLRWVNVAAHGLEDFSGSQRGDLFLERRVPFESAFQEEILRERPCQSGILGARYLSRLEVAGPGLLELRLGEPVLQGPRDLLLECRLELAGVLRRVDRECGEAAEPIQRRCEEL